MEVNNPSKILSVKPRAQICTSQQFWVTTCNAIPSAFATMATTQTIECNQSPQGTQIFHESRSNKGMDSYSLAVLGDCW